MRTKGRCGLRTPDCRIPYRCGKTGKAERVEISGMPLGLFPKAEYDEVIFRARPGDVFLFFSDGIPDAQNERRRGLWHGTAGARAGKTPPRVSRRIVDAIFAEVNQFVGGVEAFDDQTVAVIKIKDTAQKN